MGCGGSCTRQPKCCVLQYQFCLHAKSLSWYGPRINRPWSEPPASQNQVQPWGEGLRSSRCGGKITLKYDTTVSCTDWALTISVHCRSVFELLNIEVRLKDPIICVRSPYDMAFPCWGSPATSWTRDSQHIWLHARDINERFARRHKRSGYRGAQTSIDHVSCLQTLLFRDSLSATHFEAEANRRYLTRSLSIDTRRSFLRRPIDKTIRSTPMGPRALSKSMFTSLAVDYSHIYQSHAWIAWANDVPELTDYCMGTFDIGICTKYVESGYINWCQINPQGRYIKTVKKDMFMTRIKERTLYRGNSL